MARRWVHKTERLWLIDDDQLGRYVRSVAATSAPPIVVALGGEAIVSAKR